MTRALLPLCLMTVWAADAQAQSLFAPASLPTDEQTVVAPAQAPTAAPTTASGEIALHPFVWIVGGLKYDHPFPLPGQRMNDRFSALMLADFGIRGSYSTWLSFESELMANGGIGLRGTSAFEGQAALQVRKQVIHVEGGRFMGEVGRVIDEGSVDFFSEHIGNTFMQDTATRDALLYSGFNLGNGVRGTVRLVDGLRIGLAFNAGNPTSNTATLAVGGAYPPFARVYLLPFQVVGSSANKYPDDSFSSYVLTPSILLDTKYVEARIAVQGFLVDTNALSTADQNLLGFNARGTVKLNLFDGMLSPYGNFSFDRNDTVDPNNPTRRSTDKYIGLVYGGGVDFNYERKHGRNNGIGLQFEQVQFRTGSAAPTIIRYANLGSTYWFSPHLSAGARVSFWGLTDDTSRFSGELSAMLTMRLVM